MKPRALIFVSGTVLLAVSSVVSATFRLSSTALAAPAGSVAVSAQRVQTRDFRMPWQRFIVRTEGKSSSAYDEGQRLLRAGQYGAAEAAFRRAIKAHDHVAASYAGLGTASIGKKQFTAAFAAFQQATALDPRRAEYQYDAAYAALYSADYHKAVEYATNFIRLQPRDPKGYHLRFLAYGQLLQRKAQVQDAGQVVRLSPKSASAYNDFGIALGNDGKYQKSAQVLTYAISLDPKNPIYYANRGQAEYQLKQYVAALRDFQRARALTSDPVRRKQYDPAIAFLRKKTHR